MEKDWIMVRIKRTTYARLEAARKSLLWAYEMRQKELRFDDQGRVSVDQVIGILLDARERHAKRRAAALARRRQRRRLSAVAEIAEDRLLTSKLLRVAAGDQA